MKDFFNPLFFVSGFLLITACFWSCEEDVISSDDPSSIIISLPLNDVSHYDSGQLALRSVTSSESILSDLTFQGDSAYAVLETIAHGGWDLEVRLFHAGGGIVELDTNGTESFKRIDWGQAPLLICDDNHISLNSPNSPGVVNWLEAYHLNINAPEVQMIIPVDPCLYDEAALYLNGQTFDRITLFGITVHSELFKNDGEPPLPFEFGHFAAKWLDPPADIAKISEADLQFSLKDPFEGTSLEGFLLGGLDDLTDYCDQNFFEGIVRGLWIDVDTTSSADSLIVFSCRWLNGSDGEGIPDLPFDN